MSLGLPWKSIFAFRYADQPEQHLRKGCFSGSGFSYDRNKFTFMKIEIKHGLQRTVFASPKPNTFVTPLPERHGFNSLPSRICIHLPNLSLRHQAAVLSSVRQFDDLWFHTAAGWLCIRTAVCETAALRRMLQVWRSSRNCSQLLFSYTFLRNDDRSHQTFWNMDAADRIPFLLRYLFLQSVQHT